MPGLWSGFILGAVCGQVIPALLRRLLRNRRSDGEHVVGVPSTVVGRLVYLDVLHEGWGRGVLELQGKAAIQDYIRRLMCSGDYDLANSLADTFEQWGWIKFHLKLLGTATPVYFPPIFVAPAFNLNLRTPFPDDVYQHVMQIRYDYSIDELKQRIKYELGWPEHHQLCALWLQLT